MKIYLFSKESSSYLWKYNAVIQAQTIDISADGEYVAGHNDGYVNFLEYR